MFKENFIRICNKKGVPPTQVCKAIGLTASSYSQWTDATIPRRATLIKIADYLSVSVDDLLAQPAETKKSPSVSDEDIKFALFGGEGEITDEMYEEVKRFAEFVKAKHGKK